MSQFQALQLRPNFDKTQQQKVLQVQKARRHQGYLKEMLIQRFLQKHQQEIVGKGKTREVEVRLQALVVKEFERFIKEQSFTQKKLA